MLPGLANVEQRGVLSFRALPRRRLARLLLLFALSVAPLAQAAGVAVGDATAAQNDAFERKLVLGKNLLAKGKVEEALAKFRDAHAIVASPKASLMIARAYRDTGELVTAHAEYSTALSEARAAAEASPKYEEILATIRKELEDLDGVLGKLVVKLIHAPAGTEVTVDGRPVDASKLSSPLLVAPGDFDVVATAPDGEVARRMTSISAGQHATVELAFARKEEPATFFSSEASESEDDSKSGKKDADGGGIHPLVYVAGGVGVAGLATFAITGSMANSKFDDLEKACPNEQCPPERQGDIDDGKRLQTIANVGLAVGVAGVATGAALLVFGGSNGEPSKKPSATLGVGYRSIHLRGTFW